MYAFSMNVVRKKCQMLLICHYSRRPNLLIFSKFGMSLTNHVDAAAFNLRIFGVPIVRSI